MANSTSTRREKNAKYQADMKARRVEAGIVQLNLWVPADKKAEIKALVDAFIKNHSN